MDENKRQKLVHIGYQLRETCGSCVHGDVGGHGEAWGTCQLHSYDHLKHADSTRQLSIHATGWCPSFKLDETDLPRLHGFAEFLPGRGKT